MALFVEPTTYEHPHMAQSIHPPTLRRRTDRIDRLVRHVLVPALFAIGLYGLIRYLATGDGATSGGSPLLEHHDRTAQ